MLIAQTKTVKYNKQVLCWQWWWSVIVIGEILKCDLESYNTILFFIFPNVQSKYFYFCFLMENCARSTIWIADQLRDITGVRPGLSQLFSAENILLAKLCSLACEVAELVVMRDFLCWQLGNCNWQLRARYVVAVVQVGCCSDLPQYGTLRRPLLRTLSIWCGHPASSPHLTLDLPQLPPQTNFSLAMKLHR